MSSVAHRSTTLISIPVEPGYFDDGLEWTYCSDCLNKTNQLVPSGRVCQSAISVGKAAKSKATVLSVVVPLNNVHQQERDHWSCWHILPALKTIAHFHPLESHGCSTTLNFSVGHMRCGCYGIWIIICWVTKQKSVDKSHSVLTNTADFKFECSMFHQTFLSMCYVAGDTLHISGAAGSRSGR